MSDTFTLNINIHDHDTRNKQNPHIMKRKTNIAPNSFKHKGPVVWNNITNEIRKCKQIKSFSHKLKLNIIHDY